MDDRDQFQFNRFPTPARPLLGVTILAVEDSRFACEAMRLLCVRSGARIRRADSIMAAKRHLMVYRPTVLIVDHGLPDGEGADLIHEAATMSPRIPVILGTSADDLAQECCLAAGADGFLPKPTRSLAQFQELILACLPADQRPMGPRAVNDEVIQPDTLAYQDDLAHAADLLSDGNDDQILDYVAQFVTGIARSAADAPLITAGEALTIARMQGRSCGSAVANLAGLMQDRLASPVAV
ncbi:response regulator [Thalassobius vesicularis]|uniref:Response regulator n=1 Tax=Thalassobius vesicularis TaxID=1294297 RepID=A0A4S3ME62_9RHOB|nr:response regulator [Thalassobius vesicularis]THD76408.1 response regulator [Thalassobius vesicularis]